jgi:hypothetical protein
MKNTKSVRDITANLRHIANLFESADLTEFDSPVTVSVHVSPVHFSSAQALRVVDQMAAVTGAEPAWDTSSSTGPYGWYQTGLDPADVPWSVRCSSHGKRPDPAEALKAENERLRAKLAEIKQIADEGSES